MAVFDLNSVPHTEQLRWRAQRCHEHSAAPVDESGHWVTFDPLVHHQHIHSRLPTLARRTTRGQA
ncbi:hypothetical protein [Streptomyces sp. LN499]|uniref:hypothetical protein n=1 Tax=Streptomyces sp. LN499 TaxID=3112977 RepID=UPI00371BC405